jgi:hypothetical protein
MLRIITFASVQIELLLEASLCIFCSGEGTHRYFELMAAKFARCDGWRLTKPFDDAKSPLRHIVFSSALCIPGSIRGASASVFLSR